MEPSPLTLISAYTSVIRNYFSICSFGIAIVGFASAFPDNLKWYIKGMGLIMCVFGITYGIKGSLNFQEYINIVRKNNKVNMDELDQLLINHLQTWIYYTYTFTLLVVIVLIMFFYFRIEKLFPILTNKLQI